MLKFGSRFKAQSIISFGPSCLSAEILKSCNQRTATFGFDWFRSGSFHHANFIRYPTEEFLRHYVVCPSLPLVQKNNPLEHESKTSELVKRDTIYGYEVLYNPHRPYNHESYQYFKRAFLRLSIRIDPLHLSNNEDFIPPTLLLTDYINKEHYIHIPDPKKAMLYLQSLFLLRYGYKPKIIILRFNACSDQLFPEKNVSIVSSNQGLILVVPISRSIDDDVLSRRNYYRSLIPLLSEATL